MNLQISYINCKLKKGYRDVAQFGSAPVLGTGGRRFKSCHPYMQDAGREIAIVCLMATVATINSGLARAECLRGSS
jgi:hypothetical protein